MCTNPVMSYTNARYISKVSPVRFRNSFRCGMCAECIRQIRSEWRARSYYECLDTFRKGGFVLFDTLTYDDDHLKFFHDVYPDALHNYWDFACFNRKDIKDFFKRLRINLSRCGYDVDKNLRYIVTSEVGKGRSDDLLLTSRWSNLDLVKHRPHYHVLFFVNFPIDPLDFSRHVSKAWICGITDGVKSCDDCSECPVRSFCKGQCLYKHPQYVLNERVISSSDKNAIKACNYVSKYISKDLYLYKKLYRRVFCSFSISRPDWQKSYAGRLEFRRFKNQVLPFHLQSKGFGLYALSCQDIEEITTRNGLRVPTSNSDVVRLIPLSLYYKRKLFYTCRKYGGRLQWVPNDLYRKYRERLYEKSLNSLSCKLQSYAPLMTDSKFIRECARYMLLRRGVLLPPNCKDYSDLDLLHSFCDAQNYNYNVLHHYGLLYYNKSTERDSYTPEGKFISDAQQYDWIDPPVRDACHCWSPHEFERDQRLGFSSYADSDVINFCDGFLSWLSLNGEKLDLQMYKDDVQRQRYVELGLLK